MVNDKGHVIGTRAIGNKNDIFVWENGNLKNLTKFFKDNVLGDWAGISSILINNCGDILFNTYRNINTKYGLNTINKAILFKNGVFTMVLPDCIDDSISVSDLDDAENMIVGIWGEDRPTYHVWYSQGKLIYLSNGNYKLRGGFPVQNGCLRGQIKKSSKGEYYLTPGLKVQKLFKEEPPYYNVASRTTKVLGQNSIGYFVGQMDTIYPAHHAFLAIPKDN